MAEWPIASVLKTEVPQGTVSSNLTPSANSRIVMLQGLPNIKERLDYIDLRIRELDQIPCQIDITTNKRTTKYQMVCDELSCLRNECYTLNKLIASTVDYYVSIGFEKICDVRIASDFNSKWKYVNINHELLYSEHTSWVYFIVDDKTIVKVGETGVPLGIQKVDNSQPLASTKNRLGRLANMHDAATDTRIRKHLRESVKANRVSIWAKKCPIEIHQIELIDSKLSLKKTYHKELELALLDHMSSYWYHPILNPTRK